MPETKTSLTKRFAAPVLIAISLAFPVGIAAHTNEQLAKTGGMTVELPLLGGSLTVEVKLDLMGNISAVNFDPAGTVTASDDHKVKFTTADGAVTVDVKARGSKLSVKARAGSLAALSGPGTWSADVFGTGTPSTVGYTVGATADGRPTLTIGTPVVPAGVTATVAPIKTSANNVFGRVTFESDGYTKVLSIRVHVDQGGGKASLKITLSGKDKQKLSGPLADLVGARTWSAHTCDGKPVTVNFNITADGKALFVSADPTTVKVKEQKDGFRATFDGTKLRVSVKLKQAKDGQWTLKVDGKSGKCGKDDKDKKAKSEKQGKQSESERKDESPEDEN